MSFQVAYIVSPECAGRNGSRVGTCPFGLRRKRMIESLRFLPDSIPVFFHGLHSVYDRQDIAYELNRYHDIRGKKATWGRLANLASARQIWRLCAQSAAQICLVLEDDADFTIREAQVIHQLLLSYNKSTESNFRRAVPWHFLLLGSSPLSPSPNIHRTIDEHLGDGD
eukprot:CAMPEP_0113711406 /NCGR_PEP_ID=MMETSP0038_2-20120614/30735_1 /TAXON_ID=2898 /ORGANISM="Cryptomonas paramecium" /LENGTH=167 /DNA_ID=CAMNT_0000637651 /DNA_START=162 /DNA_END=662 /DNA_ORIENTATION=+ /assembly_acc=CAM_ASM_000170